MIFKAVSQELHALNGYFVFGIQIDFEREGHLLLEIHKRHWKHAFQDQTLNRIGSTDIGR